VLFNSYPFLFGFLPATLLLFFALARVSARLGSAVLVVASLFFYGWWDPRYLVLLLGSVAFNYSMSLWILRADAIRRPVLKRWLLWLTIAGNLSLLVFYKYLSFCISILNAVAGLHLPLLAFDLPLGISFFTFTQIAFVADTYRSEARERDPLHYLLFVTWFPHLIAGPVLHHKDTMPQFTMNRSGLVDWVALASGSAMFTIGIVKKVVLADGIAHYVSGGNALSAFTRSGLGLHVGFFDGWAAALAYTLQLYFDFSGYSDMAIGLSLMFGVKFPANFNSPYKAHNIVEFWRRWHMTLSRFLRDYVYVPLGGSRHGTPRRYLNLMLTMLIGGLWHGAGWTFLVWGGLHGLFLAVNHGWRSLRAMLGADLSRSTASGRFAARLVTFVAVVVGWVVFRSTTLAGAIDILEGMAGRHGFALLAADRAALGSIGEWLSAAGVRFEPAVQMSIVPVGLWIAALLPIALWLPNSLEIMGEFHVVLEGDRQRGRPVPSRVHWRPTLWWAMASAILFTIALLNLARPAEFLYYQF
jgi:D-alanyl-lipoteichoic acid acyltransferase DltB (MBOAT superfamily)